MTRKYKNNRLKDLVSFLNSKTLELSSNFEDGRVNSMANEPYIIDLIKEYYKNDETVILHLPVDRYWYDLAITYKDVDIFVPINIKITNFDNNSADNANSWKGLFWTFYNKLDVGNYTKMLNIISETNFDLIEKIDNDYYYIVVDKKKGNRVVFNSIKQLSEVVKNANNLPYQIKWGKNLEVRDNTVRESYKIIFTPIFEALKSFELRVEIGEKIEELISLL